MRRKQREAERAKRDEELEQAEKDRKAKIQYLS